MSEADEIRSVLAELADVPGDDDARLELDSLTLVQLVEALEDRFGIRIAPRDVVPTHFGSVAAIAAYVKARRA